MNNGGRCMAHCVRLCTSGGENEEKEFEQLCDELWGKAATTVVDRSVGKGRIFWETSLNLEQVLEKIQLRPDFEVSTDSISAPIRYIHRQI